MRMTGDSGGFSMTILITGGSKGIGRAIAARFARDGAHVLINYHSDDQAARDAVQLVEEAGGTGTAIKVDIGRPEGVSELVRAAGDVAERIDQVVHGAVLPVSSPAMDLDAETFQRAVWLNGAVLLPLVQGLRPLLDHGSSVVFLSSRGSRLVVPGYVSIGPAKALAESLVRYLAVELAPHGIRVNTIIAAGVLTDAVRAVLPNAEERFAKLAELNPSGRNLTVDDIAELVHSITRPEHIMLNGHSIELDGGLHLRT
jgi:enoyl-[acyl-carrier protein] reductase III